MNPFGFMIMLWIVINIIQKFWNKTRAFKLLRIIYRITHTEKKKASFDYRKLKKSDEIHLSCSWGTNEEERKLILSSERFTDLKDFSLNNYPQKYQFITLPEYYYLLKKFKEYVGFDKNIKATDFTKEHRKIIDRKSISVDAILIESKLFEEYYKFVPSENEVKFLLKYLKKKLLIVDDENVWISDIGHNYLNSNVDDIDIGFIETIAKGLFNELK